jgi:hypothetical protein
MPGNLRLRRDDLLFRVIVPVVEKNVFVVLGGRGVVNDDSGITIVQNALAGPVQARDHNLLVVEYESLVVDFVLYFYIVKVHTRRLEASSPPFAIEIGSG